MHAFPPIAMSSETTLPTPSHTALASAVTSREEPAGMEQEAQLLESFSEIPSISAAWGQDLPDGGLSLTVRLCPRCRRSKPQMYTKS